MLRETGELRGHPLSVDQRLQIVRDLDETFKYAHQKRLYHRALCPQSVLVQDVAGATPQRRIMNWKTGARKGTQNSDRVDPVRRTVGGTMHVDEYVEDPGLVYLAPAAFRDNPGTRRRRVREMLFEQLGVTDTNDVFATYPLLWRGTKREVEVLFENVREMSDEKLRRCLGTWTVVIDFPFDDPKFTPADDLAGLADYRGDDTQTLVWMPSFFSAKAQHDLGRLLDYILTGERFNELAAHRGPAQALLRNQRDQLQQRVRQYLEVAYGIAGDSRDAVVNPMAPEDQAARRTRR